MAQASDLQAKLLPSYLATVKTIKRAVQPHLALLLLLLCPLTSHFSLLFPFSLSSSFLSSLPLSLSLFLSRVPSQGLPLVHPPSPPLCRSGMFTWGPVEKCPAALPESACPEHRNSGRTFSPFSFPFFPRGSPGPLLFCSQQLVAERWLLHPRETEPAEECFAQRPTGDLQVSQDSE